MFPIINHGILVDLPINLRNIYKNLICSIENDTLQIKSSTDCNIFHHFTTNNDVITLNINVLINKEDKINKETKITNIIIGTSKEYKLTILLKGNTGINKKVKKDMTNIIERISNNNTLYSINNSGLYLINTTGFLKYYPDNDTIFESDIENLDLMKYNLINTNLNISAYDKKSFINIINSITSPEPLLEPNIISNISSNTTTTSSGGILNSIGYIASWFNPFSYIGYGNNTTINTTTNTLNEPYIDIKNTDISTINTEDINIPKYYINKTDNNKIIRILNKSYKVLEPIHMEIPTYINNIEIKDENIIMVGKINEKYNVEITFDKYNKIISVNITHI